MKSAREMFFKKIWPVLLCLFLLGSVQAEGVTSDQPTSQLVPDVTSNAAADASAITASPSPATLPPGAGTMAVPLTDPAPAPESSANPTPSPSPASGQSSNKVTGPSSTLENKESDPGSSSPSDTNQTAQNPLLTSVAPSIKPPPDDTPPNMQESPDRMAASAPQPPSENVTLNLINRLVQRGILSKEDAKDLARQALEDARKASQQAQMAQQAATQAATAQQMAMEASAPPQSDDAVSVSYVPEIVKSEIKEEVKRDVLAAAQAEGWNQPNIPEWLNKFRPFMDFRFRFQDNTYPDNTTYSNDTVPFDLVNFNAINTGAPLNMAQVPGVGAANDNYGQYPYGILAAPSSAGGGPCVVQNPAMNPPTYNNTQQREYMRIRFRFGADMNLGENFTSGFRIGTGQNGNPVSENQTLGLPGTTSQGGNFSSYAIWLDRAFLKYEIGNDPDKMAAITFGRFDNPFFTPTTIMWANDIGFDGIAAQARYKIAKGVTPFATIGIFPYFNTDLNFASTQQPKTASNDKYLYAAQAGIDWKINKDLGFKGAFGFYNFQNSQGKVSTPMVTPSSAVVGNTDDSRPSFAQVGNSYTELRNIKKVDAYQYNGGVVNGVTNTTTANYYYDPTGAVNPAYIYPQYQNQYQYFGLATPFQVVSANGRLEYKHWEPFVISLSGEYDRNIAWNYGNILNNGPAPGADNNYNTALTPGPVNNLSQSGTYQGGNNAWILQAKIGSGALQKKWDWDFGLSYRYVESDSVIDGFADSDFGGPLAGTNLKGWAIGGNLALSRNVFLGLRWFNATTIAGPLMNINTVQLDVNARF